MNQSIEFELTETERRAVRDAFASERFRAVDNRSDGVADCDALCDAARIGQRIADGFAMLRGDD
jgi:hypothetical protein